MVLNATNLNSIIENLIKNKTSYADIGKLFTYGLKVKKRDIIAFSDGISVSKLQVVQSESIRRMKSYMQMVSMEPSNYPSLYTKPKQINEESILGTIVEIIDDKGDEVFEDIGIAIHNGSQTYLRKNPLARHKNFCQFKEYRCIKLELQKLL